MNNSELFRFEDKSLSRLKIRFGIKMLFLTLATIIGAILFMFICDTYIKVSYGELTFFLPMALLAMLGIKYKNKYSEDKLLYEGYRLTISDEKIVCEHSKEAKIEILIEDIYEIQENYNGNIVIQDNKLLNKIIVPYKIDDYKHLVVKLNQLKSITRLPKIREFKLLAFISVLLPIILLYINNLILEVSLFIIFVGLVILELKQINQNRPQKILSRLLYYWLVMVLIILVIYFLYQLDTLSNNPF